MTATKGNFAVISILACLIVLLAIVLVIPFQESYGHAFVMRSNPAPSSTVSTSPSRIDVFFSEPVDIKFSKLSVINQDGKQVDNKDVSFLNGDQSSLSVTVPKLGDGVYTVSTSVLSQTDGHVTDNAFVFAVGAASIPTNVSSSLPEETVVYVPEAISRFPTLVGQVIIVGGAFSSLWLWSPVYRFQRFSAQLSEIRKRIDKRLMAVFLIASVCLVLSNLAILIFQAFSISATIGDVITTRFGIVILARIVISLTLLAITIIQYVKYRKSPTTNLRNDETIGILALGLILLFTTSMIGHGAANNQVSSIIIDFVHNLVSSIWIGGIIYFGFIMTSILRADKSLEQNRKIALLAMVIPRFSLLVIVLLGFIIFTGPLLLFILDSNLGQVASSLYGKTLIVKLMLALAMLLIGAYNQFAVQREAQSRTLVNIEVSTSSGKDRETIGSYDGDIIDNDNNNEGNQIGKNKKKRTDIITKFSRTSKAESILGIMLLASVAFLVNTGVPASETQSQASENPLADTAFQQSQDGFTSTYFDNNNSRVILSISPFDVGSNNFTISFVDSQNAPIDISSATLQYTESEESIGPINVDLNQVGKGVFEAKAAFGIPGLWDLQVEGTPKAPNSPAIVGTFNDLRVKPKLDQFQFNITEFNTLSNQSQPLYPIYDRSRNSIWVGDTTVDSSQILEYKIAAKEFVEHKIHGTSIITIMTLDSKNNIWFIDPINKLIGSYNIESEQSRLFPLPKEIVPSSMAVDPNDRLWIASSPTSQILIFDPAVNSITKIIELEKGSRPLAIAINPSSAVAWVSDERGKLIKIDPAKDYNSTVFVPTAPNSTLKSPTALLLDDVNNKVYISQHEGQRVSVFDTILETFQDYPPLNPEGLPFGMAFDKYGNIWVAEHTINKIGVIDPQTGTTKEVTIPNPSPFVQWITTDSDGNIWIAEQRGHSLGLVTSQVSGQPSIAPPKTPASTSPSQSESNSLLNYNFIAVAIVIGLVLVAFVYVKNVIDCKVAERTLRKYESI